ncbi:hypothetical protein SPF06_19945 [Sinomonas sp. JGH33]|uniref:Ig-like domain-containing protein n=1 Tax=Sinomonas terricola TaxID=3110330 RepID=A0ABU5TBT9_9MICC|nr:hypothetical protein [Sinomonas sp. JGH33]MEA5457002.1 hypothetical protein [Sinomonas sp. JGH33]
MRRWKHLLGVAAVGVLPAAILVMGASGASAAPLNAPSALEGTFDCGSAGTGTFVVNNGNAQAAVTWDVAHVTFTTGANAGETGIFVPDSFTLVGMFNGQTVFTETASKKAPAATVACTISASQTMPGGGVFTLTGDVAGKTVVTG